MADEDEPFALANEHALLGIDALPDDPTDKALLLEDAFRLELYALYIKMRNEQAGPLVEKGTVMPTDKARRHWTADESALHQVSTLMDELQEWAISDAGNGDKTFGLISREAMRIVGGHAARNFTKKDAFWRQRQQYIDGLAADVRVKKTEQLDKGIQRFLNAAPFMYARGLVSTSGFAYGHIQSERHLRLLLRRAELEVAPNHVGVAACVHPWAQFVNFWMRTYGGKHHFMMSESDEEDEAQLFGIKQKIRVDMRVRDKPLFAYSVTMINFSEQNPQRPPYVSLRFAMAEYVFLIYGGDFVAPTPTGMAKASRNMVEEQNQLKNAVQRIEAFLVQGEDGIAIATPAFRQAHRQLKERNAQVKKKRLEMLGIPASSSAGPDKPSAPDEDPPGGGVEGAFRPAGQQGTPPELEQIAKAVEKGWTATMDNLALVNNGQVPGGGMDGGTWQDISEAPDRNAHDGTADLLLGNAAAAGEVDLLLGNAAAGTGGVDLDLGNAASTGGVDEMQEDGYGDEDGLVLLQAGGSGPWLGLDATDDGEDWLKGMLND